VVPNAGLQPDATLVANAHVGSLRAGSDVRPNIDPRIDPAGPNKDDRLANLLPELVEPMGIKPMTS
jgi:hypothetical protein